MKKIETESKYEYNRLFDAVIDTAKLFCETVGQDEKGNFILHKSSTYNYGNAYSNADEYFVLTGGEYLQYLDKARKNRRVGIFKYGKFKKIAGGKGMNAEKIKSFEIITLHTSGMRCTEEFEMIVKDGAVQITEYGIRYDREETRRVPQRQNVCGVEEALKLLNDCDIMKWNGFHGAHPKGVLDGTMFTFEATVNDGAKIRASGSQNFPKHYRDFTDGLYEILRRDK